MQARHRMRRTEIWATGAEEWWCPDCARRLLLRWPPNYAKVVLDPVDERASHTGAMAVADGPLGGPAVGHRLGAVAGRDRLRPAPHPDRVAAVARWPCP